MGEHWMSISEVNVACHLEVRRDSFIWGIPNSCLICPHHCKLWPRALDAPFLASLLLTDPPQSERASQVYPCPGPHPTIHPWGSGTRVYFAIVVHHRNPQGISSPVEYLKETAQLSPLPELCGQECNMHWRKLFYFHFCKQWAAWPGPRTGGEWPAAGQELTWPLPLLLCFLGASQEGA